MDFDSIKEYLVVRPPWLIYLTSAVIGLLVSWLILATLALLARLRRNRRGGQLFNIIYTNTTNVLYFFFPVLFLTLTSLSFQVYFPKFYWFSPFFKVLLTAVSTWLVIRMVAIMEKVLINRLDINNPNNYNARRIFTKVQFIRRIVNVFLVIIGVSLLLLSFERVREYGVGILTSAGIASVIIGFAAQKTLANLLAGIQIAFTQPIKIDDVVIVENEWGRIEEINLTYIVVKLWDLRRLVLPITYFIEKPFQNWTRNQANIVGNVMLYLDYHTPVDKLRLKLNEFVRDTSFWDGEVCSLQVVDTQAQYIVVRCLLSARNAGDAFELRCMVREKMIEYIRSEHPESLPGFRIMASTGEPVIK